MGDTPATQTQTTPAETNNTPVNNDLGPDLLGFDLGEDVGAVQTPQPGLMAPPSKTGGNATDNTGGMDLMGLDLGGNTGGQTTP